MNCISTTLTEYIRRITPVVQTIRQLLPSARIAAEVFFDELLGTGGSWAVSGWNEQLRKTNAGGVMSQVDAVTIHDYLLNDDRLQSFTEAEQPSALLAWPQATMRRAAAALGQQFPNKTAWVTEYGILGRNYDENHLLQCARLGSMHGIFIIARVLAAVDQHTVYEALQYFNLGANGLQANSHTDTLVNATDLDNITANGAAQIWSHVAMVALDSTHMHRVNHGSFSMATSSSTITASTGVHEPILPFPILGVNLTCIQAAAFSGGNRHLLAFVLINRCTQAVPIHLQQRALHLSQATSMSLCIYRGVSGDGGWAKLPPSGGTFPWNAPLRPATWAGPVTNTTHVLPATSLAIATFDAER